MSPRESLHRLHAAACIMARFTLAQGGERYAAEALAGSPSLLALFPLPADAEPHECADSGDEPTHGGNARLVAAPKERPPSGHAADLMAAFTGRV